MMYRDNRNLFNLIVILIGLIIPVVAYATHISLSTQPIGNVAGPALSSANLASGSGQLFDIRFTSRDPLSTETTIYDADEHTTDHIWSGNLISTDVDTSGVLSSTINWEARVTLETQNWDTGRYIFTSDGSTTGIKFRWADLKTASLAATVDSVTPLSDTTSPIVDWLRGDHTNEVVNSGTLRTRQFKKATVLSNYSLGDIIHSSPAYVSKPDESYTFNDYAGFRTDQVNREEMVYVGSNDGMLHAFRASDGKEVFAFIPNAVLGNLSTLSGTSYLTQHKYLVDGSPTAGDVCFDSCASKSDWRTVLVGGLNGGGKTIYALNITDPVTAVADDETKAKDLFMWEFTDAADLGYTYAQPKIVRLSDGTWVAIFGNGYNSTNENAVLFVVNIQTGALIQKITVNTGTNGLSTPVLLDIDSDHDVDYVYAGDLKGNMWKFDFTSATSSGGVTVSYSGSALGNVGQPITSKPEVRTLDSGGYGVYFGTGKLLEASDTSDKTLYGLYMLIDRSSFTPSGGWGSTPNLVVHTLEDSPFGITYLRTINDTTTPTTGTIAGWKVELPGQKTSPGGERIINNLIVRSGRVMVTTVDPTVQYNRNWRIGVDATTGGAPGSPYFDIASDPLGTFKGGPDGIIDSYDLFDHDDDGAGGTPTIVPIGQDEALGVVSGPVAARIVNDLDVIYVTHEQDVIITSNPFNDPGLAGGHFDVDNFNAVNVEYCSKTVKGTFSTTEKCHVHQFDDDYNVNGINLLKSVDTYNLLGVNIGKGLITGEAQINGKGEVTGKLRESDADDTKICNKWVTINIVNPDPAMTTDPGILDPETGIISGGGDDVEPARIKFKIAGQTLIDMYVVPFDTQTASFNGLPTANRTAKACDIEVFEISFENINALRATEPGAVQNKKGDCPDTGLPGGYRDGAIVIRATSANGFSQSDEGKVLYETAVYEHLKEDTLIVPDGVTVNIGCGGNGEDLRQYKDPSKFTGATAGTGGTGSGVTVGGGGTGVGFSGSSGTGGGIYSGTYLGEQNWREILAQ